MINAISDIKDPNGYAPVLQKDHEQVPRILDDLRESLEIVESIRYTRDGIATRHRLILLT